jgi:hypothetical protein
MPPLHLSGCQNCAALRDAAANFFSLASSLALAANLVVMCDSHKPLAADEEILGFLMRPSSHSILREVNNPPSSSALSLHISFVIGIYVHLCLWSDGARSPVSRLHEEDKGFCFLRFIGPVYHLANNDL